MRMGWGGASKNEESGIFGRDIVGRMKLSEVLKERGYLYQHSSEKLEEITDGPKRTVYEGFDPSAD